jgi:predicted nuclease of predicted toxin-antitoxin system
VIWIRRGNCSTGEVATLLRDHHEEMLAFERDPEGSFLALG